MSTNAVSTVAENLEAIRERMQSACTRAGRDMAGVRLVGVTKTVPVERVREGVLAGLATLGENYVQEALGKIEALADMRVSWHFIGRLQTNKAKAVAPHFDWVHTVDRERLAVELDRQAKKLGKPLSVLIEVELGGEESKSGVSPEGLPALFKAISSLDGLHVRGLMALPPFFDDPEAARPYFKQLRELLDRLRDASPEPGRLTELSMGMSNDFDVAIEEGATIIRVGTALFGARPPRGAAAG